MDFFEAPVTDYIRPFRGRPDIEVQRVWYPAAEGAPTLGFPSAFTSLHWERYPWMKTGVGQVYPEVIGWPRTQSIPGLSYEHVCGTEDAFLNGVDYDPDIAPIEYDTDGIPACCPRVVDPGGVALYGTSPQMMYGATYYHNGPNPTNLRTVCTSIFRDRRWVGTEGGRPWDLRSPLQTGVPGTWSLEDIPVVEGIYYSSSSWNGRGSMVFNRFGGGAGPATITVLNVDPAQWWYPISPGICFE